MRLFYHNYRTVVAISLNSKYVLTSNLPQAHSTIQIKLFEVAHPWSCRAPSLKPLPENILALWQTGHRSGRLDFAGQVFNPIQSHFALYTGQHLSNYLTKTRTRLKASPLYFGFDWFERFSLKGCGVCTRLLVLGLACVRFGVSGASVDCLRFPSAGKSAPPALRTLEPNCFFYVPWYSVLKCTWIITVFPICPILGISAFHIFGMPLNYRNCRISFVLQILL